MIPDAVRRVAGTDDVVPVWRNDIGGVTYRLGHDRYVKWQPLHPETSIPTEAAKLAWTRQFTVVPSVIETGSDGDAAWLVTESLPGRNAVDPYWISRPDTAVRAVGRGLRAFHDAVPTADCPWTWSTGDRIADARSRGRSVPSRLRDAPDVDHVVVCHGDACCPNVLLHDDGSVSAHLDLGWLGVADRWADIAVAALSVTRNYGPGWEGTLVDAYGVDWDATRMAYYQDLWNET